MNAEILSVGTELLLGDIVNTNAHYISKELAALGISVYYQTVVGDNQARLFDAYKKAFERSDIVITTGGLGPTEDDLTKEIGAKIFNKKLVLDETVLENIKTYFTKIGREYDFTQNNVKQAYFPENSLILKNDNGTAPGCLIEENGKYLFMLPGPPNEMVPMFENEVKPILLEKSDAVFHSITLKICGIGESKLEQMIKDMLDNQTNPTLALYAKTNEVHLRITAKSENKESALTMIAPFIDKLKTELGDNIYSTNGDELHIMVIKSIIKKNYTISVAESCTGGLITSKFIDYSGVSKCFLEGIITYSNESKILRLGVKRETLETYGAVSPETAMEMATGVAKSLNTNIGLATTGIAGPDGGTEEKPIGLVYLGLYINGKVYTKKLNLSGNRQKIRERATISAIDFLRRHL